jgi:3-hydroxyisobutyrate dehydrogenase-like beta-hydroxyacid dehydrogenase
MAQVYVPGECSMRIGFIGLGQMGRGMARRLLDCGCAVRVWNRSRAAVEALETSGASVAGRPEELLDADVVITMLADDAALEAVWIAAGLAGKMPASSIHLNMASVSVRMGRRLADVHRAAGAQYVSAPVFGRPEAAAAGQLDIVAAGAEAAVARCAPLFGMLGRRWFNAGAEAHHANVVKVARNFMLGTIIESLGEAFALVGNCGVDPAMFLEVITSTSMNAPAYKAYGQWMLERSAPATFTLRLGLKDVELAIQAAEDAGVALPLAALLRDQHRAAIARGYGDRDWAALGNYITESTAR